MHAGDTRRQGILDDVCPHPVNLPGGATSLGRNDALGMQHLADLLLVALAIARRIGQHQPSEDPLMGCAHPAGARWHRRGSGHAGPSAPG